MFLRVFQHLLPTGQAWRTTIVGKTLRKFFEGLAPAHERVKVFADDVLLDAFPDTTRLFALAEWERQFGIEPNPDEAIRRLNLAAEWAAGGGQSPSYIQGVLQTAGFNVFVHDWWSSGPPYVARDPRDYTLPVHIGTVQCSAFGWPDQAQCIGFTDGGIPLDGQPQCNAFLAGDPGYLVNKDLTPRPPPPIPSDPRFWAHFIYVGAETFPNKANLSSARRDEFERLLLKLRPAEKWIVTLVTYGGIFDDTFDNSFQ